MKKLFAYWGKTEEYQDLIIREYYQLLEAEVLNLIESNLNRSNKELGKEIANILSDSRISDILSKENELSTKKPYEITLWNSFQKGNNHVIIVLVKRKINAKNNKIKLGKWFN